MAPRCISQLASLAALLAACARAATPSGSIALVDDAGDTVRLAQPARRIASLVPATTELLFAIGAGPYVVGRTAWCDWPPEAAAVPSLGDGLSPNVEAIVASRPDLVVLYRSARNAAAAERLRSLGVPTIQVRTDSFDDLGRNADLLGLATGQEDSARAVTMRLREQLSTVDRRGAVEGPRVLILAWDQPPMTIGRGSFLHELVTMAGGRNLFDDLEAPSSPVSLEAIASRNPDLILTTAESPAFAERPEWQSIRAVREHRFLRVQGSEYSRPSPRAPDAIRRLARAIDSLAAR